MGINWGLVLNEVDNALAYFASQNVKPTLRTLFYYLYSKQLIPNTQSAYKQLSRKLVKARKQGRYSWDFLEDKTRVVLGGLDDSRFDDDELDRFQKRLEETLENLSLEKMLEETFDYLMPWFRVGIWAEQPKAVEIWIEKEALASTIQAWCEGLGIPIRVNRGYSSWTFIYHNVGALKNHLTNHDEVTVYYLGDLDPSGVDIQRFLEEALEYFGIDFTKVELKRLAVTPEQVETYNLPPRPEDAETIAKLHRDPRYKNYNYQYIVELDALLAYAPQEFRRLVQDAIKSQWDETIYKEWRAKAENLRQEAYKLLEEIKEKAKQKILDEIGGS